MRLWYWFLLILLAIAIILVAVGQYYIFIVGKVGFGWELSMYGTVILAFLLAVGFLYFERWRRRWWEK
jgi:hypothetical protein